MLEWLADRTSGWIGKMKLSESSEEMHVPSPPTAGRGTPDPKTSAIRDAPEI